MSNPYGASTFTAAHFGQPAYGSGSGIVKAPLTRTRSEFVVAGTSLLIPWVVFTVNWALLSFTVRYRHQQLCWFAVELSFCLICVEAYFAYRAWRRRSIRDPTWCVFLFLATALGWVLGVSLGMVNYAAHMRLYYDVASLEMYVNIDPATTNGLQYLDAGRIVFTKDAYLDVSRAGGVKHAVGYCAAPVTTSSDKLASYDYWVVGTNCCSPTGEFFKCAGDPASPKAHSGMRLLDNGDVEHYRRAVEQAESKHSISARHPMFFTWVEDPVTSVNSHQEVGFKNFLLGTLIYFAFQLFCVALVGAGAFRLGHGIK
mmetsp:Transcript_86962/g.221436  ORF Transcript_86962/g.221436 Transcript_86962/m.221436 type:complete len:314 (-) Transcript_86962:128-1069(-)